MNESAKCMWSFTFLIIFNMLLIVSNPILPSWVMFFVTLLNISLSSICVVNYIRWRKKKKKKRYSF